MRFCVFKDGKAAKDFTVNAGYLFGADTIPLRYTDEIKCINGVIEINKKSPESVGMALLWDVKGFGNFLLPTTRLPQREEPYILNVELARARLMQVTLKQEDWALFEDSYSFTHLADEAKELFIEALQKIGDPEQASVLADQSLEKGMEFSEKLASRYAELFLAARYKSKGLGRHSLGCVIDPERLGDAKYSKYVTDMFGFVTIPVNWAAIEKQRGKFDFSGLDRCFDSLEGKKLAICAGPLVRFNRQNVPSWLSEEKEFEKIREACYGFVSKIVTRYAKYVHAWRVISGAHAENLLGFSFDQIVEITRTCCLAAKAADSKSRKMVEILYPWGEYYASDKNTIPPLVYTDMVIQSGINFDAFSVVLQFGADLPGMHVRDMMQVSSRLDCFAQVPKPLHITGVAVPDNCEPGRVDTDKAGYWHKKWDQNVQGQWLENFYKIALGRPFINSVTYSHLADSADSVIPGAGLFSEDLKPKKALGVVAKFQKLICGKK